MKRFVIAAWLAGCTADAVTTVDAMHRGSVELVLTQSPAANVVIVGGEAVIGTVSLVKLHRTHPKFAIALGIGMASFRFTVAAHNNRQNR